MAGHLDRRRRPQAVAAFEKTGPRGTDLPTHFTNARTTLGRFLLRLQGRQIHRVRGMKETGAVCRKPDHIIVMNEGSVEIVGTPEERLRSSDYYRLFSQTI